MKVGVSRYIVNMMRDDLITCVRSSAGRAEIDIKIYFVKLFSLIDLMAINISCNLSMASTLLVRFLA